MNKQELVNLLSRLDEDSIYRVTKVLRDQWRGHRLGKKRKHITFDELQTLTDFVDAFEQAHAAALARVTTGGDLDE